MESIKQILESTRVDGVFHTHVSMVTPKGKYLFSRTDMESFWSNYCTFLEAKNFSFGIAEVPQTYSPVLVDIDIKISEPDLNPALLDKIKNKKFAGEHIYTKSHVTQLIDVYQSVFRQIIDDCSDEHLVCCLLEKQIHKVEKNGKVFYKNGFHLHFPNTFLSRQHQEKYLNPRIVEALKELKVFEDIGIEDSSSVFDSGICGKPWLIYGCKKEGGKPYLLTKVFDADMNEISLKDAFAEYQIFDKDEQPVMICEKAEWYLPRILSIIPYNRSSSKIKTGLDSIASERQRLKTTSSRPKQNLKTTVEENLNMAERLLPMLSQHRAENHDEWMTIGWVMFNVSEGCCEGLDLWIEFSSRDETNFDEDECIRRWECMVKRDYSIGTLKYYAKTDSPEMYNEFVKEESMKYMEASVEGSHHDIAKLLYAEYGTEFVCSSVAGKTWYQFKENFWEEIEEGVFLRNRISSEIVEKYKKAGCEQMMKISPDTKNDPAQTKIKQTYKIIEKLKSTPFKKNVMTESADVFYNKDFKNKLDTNPYLFAFKNGVYDLKTNVFRNGRPEDYLSNHSPIDFYEFSMTDPKVIAVQDFLTKVFPDTSIRKYFLDQSSDIFVGGNHQKVVLFWTGESGDNGKSVTQTFFEKMLGSMAIKFSTTLITGKKTQTGAAGPELARAGGGVRLGVLEEPDIDEQINAGLFKSLSGNDSYWARDLFEKGKSTREITPLFKLIFICNGLPQFRHADKAVWNRVRVIPFETTFVKNKADCPATFEEQLLKKQFPMDTEFSKKIPDLVPAFAWLLLEHRKSIIGKERFEPEKVRSATELYRKQNDIYRQYVEERIIEETSKIVRLEELYEDFKEWYRGSFPGGSVPPKHMVKDYFTKTWGDMDTGAKWTGYRLRTMEDDCGVSDEDADEEDMDVFNPPI